MNIYQQLAVVIGPVVITAGLGPVLLMLMSKAKTRAETENYEVLSDKARFEAMDLLVNHLRQEIERLKTDVTTERTMSTAERAKANELQNLSVDHDRISADVARWAITMAETLEKAGLPQPERPAKVDVFLNAVGYPTVVVQVPKEPAEERPEDS
jgi:hypothetical protein